MKRISLWMMIVIMPLIPFITIAQEKQAETVDKRPDQAVEMKPFFEASFARPNPARAINPAISAMVSAIHEDTLRATLQEMQNLGSRFLMNDNKKEIAISLINKFLSYGYTDVRLDSFYLIVSWSGLSDSSWQYNVICTLPGSSAPQEIYVVGGHWDSICLSDPINDAPGVDDNGTAVAATLEIARVMKLNNYQPEATIQFTLFAAEELGLFGSRDAAAKARLTGCDIRYMLNMDMISNNPDNLAQVKIYQYYGFEWAGLVAAEATERYTDLSVVFPQNLVNTGSDSFPYWLEGFPSAYFEEIVFSPNWHRISDTLGNCNIPYLKKVTGGVLATLAEQQSLPHPQNLFARSSKEKISLSWKQTLNSNLLGVNVYRSDIKGSGYQKINMSPVTDSAYFDYPQQVNKQFHYVITVVNDSLEESAFSNEVIGARFNFTDTLLVVANTKGNKVTPDSIRAFYDAVLDTIPYVWVDLNAEQRLDLTQLSRYRSVYWMSNTLEYEPADQELYYSLLAFLENKGNLLYTGFYPAKFWISSAIPYPSHLPEGVFFRELFKVDSIDRKVTSMLNRANAVFPGYDTLHVDSLKQMDKNFPGQIYNIEVYEPTPEAHVIYRFGSKYDSTTTYGKMKNRPVGLEYMGNDYKTILLSFPLWYMDTVDAREFIKYVMTKKFGYPVGLHQPVLAESFDMQLYPNPANETVNLVFTLDQPGRVRISLVSLMGQPVATLADRHFERGEHRLRFSTGSLGPGIYDVLLKQGKGEWMKKLIVIR